MVAKKSPAIIAKEAERCYELAAAGMSTRQIAEELNMSQSVVVRRMHAHIKEHEHGNADKWRELQLADLLNLRRRLQKQVETGDIKAIGQAVRIWERIARMIGTDSAQLFKVEATAVTRESDASDVQKMLDSYFSSATDQPRRTIPGEIVTSNGHTRRRRPLKPSEPVRYAATRDEFASEPDATEETDPALEEFEPEPAPRPRRKSKPVQNPAHRFLTDDDD